MFKNVLSIQCLLVMVLIVPIVQGYENIKCKNDSILNISELKKKVNSEYYEKMNYSVPSFFTTKIGCVVWTDSSSQFAHQGDTIYKVEISSTDDTLLARVLVRIDSFKTQWIYLKKDTIALFK
jgi:hypothetical protein